MKPTWAELSATALALAACRYEVNGSLVFKSESPAATCLLTGDGAALKKNRLSVRRKVTDELGSVYGANFEQHCSVPVNEGFSF